MKSSKRKRSPAVQKRSTASTDGSDEEGCANHSINNKKAKNAKSNSNNNHRPLVAGGGLLLTGRFVDRIVLCRVNFNDVPLLLFKWRNVKESMMRRNDECGDNDCCAAVDVTIASARVNALIDKLLE